jgi:hypothetical protein
MIKAAAKSIFAVWTSVLLVLAQVFVAAPAPAQATADYQPACRSCAPGCTCCVKPSDSSQTPDPAAPANSTLQREWAGVVAMVPPSAALVRAFSRVSACLAEARVSSTVPIFERDCAYLL